MKVRASEIIVVDQTENHADEVEAELKKSAANGEFVWLRVTKPNIPGAMNCGLRKSHGDVVLFLDDDVLPMPNLIEAHIAAHKEHKVSVVAGQVLQPGEQVLGDEEELYEGGNCDDPDAFRFNSNRPLDVERIIGCNFSVRRKDAIEVGGFDENFVGAGYRFEAEFSRRLLATGRRILFYPKASIRHLKIGSGGTRSVGSHLRAFRPHHSVGEYYYLIGANDLNGRWRRFFSRPFRSVATRYHLKHPWWIPAVLVGELSGMACAVRLRFQGPRLVEKGVEFGEGSMP